MDWNVLVKKPILKSLLSFSKRRVVHTLGDLYLFNSFGLKKFCMVLINTSNLLNLNNYFINDYSKINVVWDGNFICKINLV